MAKTKTERICVDCGCVFIAYPPAKRCDSCAIAHYQEFMAKRRKKARTTKYQNVCTVCGATTEHTLRTRYCISCAVAKIKETSREKGKSYYILGKENGFERVCKTCNIVFVTKKSGRKICDACFAANREEMKKRGIEKRGQKKEKSKKEKGFKPDEYIYERKRSKGRIVYKAGITLEGKQIHLGYFRTKDEAIQARMDAYNAHKKENKL